MTNYTVCGFICKSVLSAFIPVCLYVFSVWTWTQRNPVCSTSPLHLAALSATTSHPAKKAAPASCQFVCCCFCLCVYVCVRPSTSVPHLHDPLPSSWRAAPSRVSQSLCIWLSIRGPSLWTVSVWGSMCSVLREKRKKKNRTPFLSIALAFSPSLRRRLQYTLVFPCLLRVAPLKSPLCAIIHLLLWMTWALWDLHFQLVVG